MKDLPDDRSVAIYSRKSKFTGKGESIENQIECCRRQLHLLYGSLENVKIKVFEDEGYSGGNTKRPQFQNLMEACEGKEIGTIICYRLDRISRNTSDFVRLIEELEKLDVAFISVKESFDTRTSMGRTMMFLCSVFAQFERDTIAERIRDNMMELAKTGRWLGGTTPTGYCSIEITGSYTAAGKARKMHILSKVPEEARIVRCIGEKFLETNSLTKVETYLLQNEILTKNNKYFSRMAIRDILKNPVYMSADSEAWNYFQEQGLDVFASREQFNGEFGIITYNKTSQSKVVTGQINDMSKWVIAIGKHEPVFTGKEWIEIHKKLEQNKVKSYRKPRNNIALLSGLLYCGSCGSYLRPKKARGITQQREPKFYYLCELKEKSKMARCTAKNPDGNLLDKQINQIIPELPESKSEFIKQTKEAKKILAKSKTSNEAEIKRIEKNIRQNEKDIRILVRNMAECESRIAYDYVEKEIEGLHKRNADLKSRAEDLKSSRETSSGQSSRLTSVKEILRSYRTVFDLMNLEQKRNALRLIIEEIIVEGEDVHIYLLGTKRKKQISAPLHKECK